jgi:hypothetical protein
MQLNVYVPKDKEHLLDDIARQAEETGRSKNELILEGIERQVASGRVPTYGTYNLGARSLRREELYEDFVE